MLQPDKLKKLNENAAKMAQAGKSKEDILAMKDAFIKQFGSEEPLKKKDIGVSSTPTPQQSTTVLPSADGSLATQKPTKEVIPITKSGMPLAVPAFFSEAVKTTFQAADDAIVSARKILQEQGFFDDDIPDTDSPISDAVKNKILSKQGKNLPLPNGIEVMKNQEDGVLNPSPFIKGAAKIGLKVINSTLPQDKKNVIISALNLGSATLKRSVRDIEKLQDKTLPKDNLLVTAGKGIVGMAPELAVAAATENPTAAEGSLTRTAIEISKDAKPLIQKYLPKAAKFVERAVKAPFTKIMAGKGVLSGVANAKEGEDIVEAGTQGGLEGAKEGIIMHGLGEISGKVMPKIAKQISRTGVNSAIATGIANPLANAGVFTTAKALRKAVEEQKLITPEEAALEAATGVGFSLLHAGSLAKNHNELNHYADNVLKTNEVESFKRVVNETKDNLDLVYNPDLTPEDISELETARDEMKSAVLKEPDLNNKQLLINEALKIQNQLDAHSAINNIVENKDAIIDEINSNPDTSEDVKEFYTQKIAAIADHFDNSEYGLKKKELNAKIDEAQKKLDDASLAFTNLKKPSDRIQAKIEVEKRKAEVEDLNNQLTELITNKVNENAVQEPTTNESVLRTEQPQLELQGVGEGNAQPETVTEEEVITEKPEEIKEPSIVVHATADERGFALNYSEGIKESYITSPEDVRDFKRTATDEQKTEFSKGKAVITTNEVAENGDKNISFVSEISDPTGRAGGTVFDFVIPKGNKASAEGIKNIYDEVSKGLKGKELIKETVKQIKQYIDSNKPTEGPPPMPEGFDVFAENKPAEVVAEEPKSEIKTERTVKDIESDREKDLKKYDERDSRSLEQITPKNPNHEILQVGQEWDFGYNAKATFFDERTTNEEGIGVVTKVIEAGEYDSNGKLKKAPVVEVTFFDSKEQADKYIEDRYNKIKEKVDKKEAQNKVNAKYDEELKSLEKPETTQTVDEAIKTLQESKEYAEADDIQKEALVRATRKDFGLKEKAAPSVNRLFGKIKDVTKITMTEKAGLVKQIKDIAKGARQSIQEWKKQTKELIDELSELEKLGKITLSQQTAIINKFGKINIFSEKSVNRFTDYVTKVFADANYKEKLNTARKNLSSIRQLSKDETKNGDLRALGTEFVKIDPSMVENIDRYNDLSSKIKEAIDGSKIRKKDVKFAQTVDIEKATEYIEKTIEEQDKKLREEKIAELQDLLGVDAKDFSAEEIDSLLESDKELSKDDIKIVRSTIKKAFDVYTTVIKEMLSTGEDPFTGEDISFNKKQEDLIKRFMDIDPNKIEDPKEALRVVDSLINFIQNKSTAGMLKPIADYEAIKGGDEAVATGLKAIRIRKYFSEKLGRALGQKTTTLPVLVEKMFKGVNRSLDFEELVGVSDLINNSSKAESETNLIAKDYIKKFYNKKANGEAYNSAYNDIERGVLAHIMRNVIGIESRMKKVFDKRKQEVLDTIDLLSSKGNESEQEIAKLIKKAYDKILDGSENIKDAKSKADINNVEGVNYWVNQWSKRYEALSDLALNFYNKVLGKDLGYTPDKVIKLQDKREDVDLEDTKSQFFANTDDILYDKKSGTLMDKQEDRKIPKDMYIDFSFDKKNGNAMSDALTDLYTAFDIRKVGSFLKSDNFNKIIPSSRDANLYDKRIKKFVKITRRKTPFQNSEVSDLIKKADRLAKLGITMSLASGRQPFIQSIPVMVSTAINAGGVNPVIGFEPKYSKWLQDLGYAISNRGVESQGQLESMNKLLEKAADMPRDKALKFIEKIQDESLKLLLVKGDVAVARASFKAYYEQSLKQQGKEYKNIDYNNHEPNKRAANYAQRMVDRQQNISNPALAGDLFTSESNASKIFVKMLMPFSSFRMNQSARLGSDLTTLEYWNTSTKADKIIALKSIAGYTAEAAAYRALQIGATLLFNSIASAIMGKDDEKKDKKSLNNSIKGAAQGTFVDTFSPIPLADPFTQDALTYSAEELQDVMDIPEKDKIKLFEEKEQSAIKMLGTYGIPITKAKEIYDLGRLAYTKKYKDKYGNEKKISQENADKLKIFIGPLMAVTVVGAFSPDISTITRKAIKMSQKKGGISKEELKKKDPEMYRIIYGND